MRVCGQMKPGRGRSPDRNSRHVKLEIGQSLNRR